MVRERRRCSVDSSAVTVTVKLQAEDLAEGMGINCRKYCETAHVAVAFRLEVALDADDDLIL